jgi:hypothetical protein
MYSTYEFFIKEGLHKRKEEKADKNDTDNTDDNEVEKNLIIRKQENYTGPSPNIGPNISLQPYKLRVYPSPVEAELGASNPKVWGPPLWFVLHTSATYYPEDPSPIVTSRMKNRILALPYEIPCTTCRPHAISFIENNRHLLDDIVSNKHKLGKFYVDFHNQVNKRYNKPEWSYEQAYDYYSKSRT